METKEKKVDRRKIPLAERDKPSTGQSGEPIELPYDELNKREAKVVELLNGDGKGQREAKSVEEMAKALWPRDGQSRSKLLVRNAMRRLVCGGWVEKPDRGVYKITEKARKRMANVKKADATPTPKPKKESKKAPKPEPVVEQAAQE